MLQFWSCVEYPFDFHYSQISSKPEVIVSAIVTSMVHLRLLLFLIFIKDLAKDIELNIRYFVNDLIELNKKKIQMNLNKLRYSEDIW